jgi:uncharacterized protein (DUF58 family)
VARKTLRGVGRGERRSKRHGGTVEFADYRGYAPGDDTRQIDWYAYARFEELYLKLYMEEQDLTVHLLLDQSASMGAGDPPKLAYARRVAVALAYVGLAGGDRVTLRPIRGGERGSPFGPLQGRRGLVRLLRYLGRDPAASGRTSLDAATQAFLAARPAVGLVIVLSDLLDPAGWRRPLQRLRAAGHEVHVIHLVAPDEVEPQVGEDVELEDAETGEVVSVALTRRAVSRYRAAFADWVAQVEADCRRDEVGHVLARTDAPFEELVLETLRRGALVR